MSVISVISWPIATGRWAQMGRQDHPAVLRGENGRGPHGAVGLGSRHAQPAAGRDPGGTGHRRFMSGRFGVGTRGRELADVCHVC